MSSRIKILLVEDEAITVMALRIELEQAGFHVIRCVATGEEALSSVVQEKPDAIVMDMRLPGRLNGLEAADRIRESHTIPIIFMTGYPDADLLEHVNRMDSAGYVVKPVSVSSLVAAIDSVLNRKTS